MAIRRVPWPALLLALVLSACAAQQVPKPSEGGLAPLRAQTLHAALESGFAAAQAIYIEPVAPKRLALLGLEGLSEIAPDVACRLEDGGVALYAGNAPVARTSPPPAATAGGWAAAATDLLIAGRPRIPALAAASPSAIRDAVLSGMARGLDRYSRYVSPETAAAAGNGPGLRSSSDDGRPAALTHRRMGDLGYLRLRRFDDATADGVREAVTAFAGDGVRGVILDLRDNPGGVLTAAVETADLFLSDGPIVRVAGRHPDSRNAFKADRDELAPDMPIAILVNAGSASASEVLAASLRDRGRAVLVGSRTYGKDKVQVVEPLPGGGELILTWARYRTPSGARIAPRGIAPALCTSDESASRASPRPSAGCPRSEAVAEADIQAAIELLRKPAAYARLHRQQAARLAEDSGRTAATLAARRVGISGPAERSRRPSF